jgi:hypothetical protein
MTMRARSAFQAMALARWSSLEEAGCGLVEAPGEYALLLQAGPEVPDPVAAVGRGRKAPGRA